ncbi:ribbon-helix-helix protein, CopG family [Clostridium sp. FP2]|uniref:ribbon-helix-helix protein, CopG family n=1 Tax=Clostridium sp. FP2 TaxID=2724481 RepID=UPI001CCFB2AB|nr:ribbon-helix-helix protein, CopG family [Clostridium sp. FP2]MBZ9626351.1 ribbon-helix-helix protein, CopG family [Clostridium sp. FP2]
MKTEMLQKKKQAEQNSEIKMNVISSNDINVSNNENKDVNKSVNMQRQGVITIAKKKSEEDKLIRATYYVRGSQDEKLEKLAKMTGKGKNEILRELLDSALNMIQVVEE